MSRILNLLLLVISASLLYVIFDVFYDSIMHDLAMRKLEGICIADLVSQAIERKDILTSNGTCWVK